MKIEIYLILMNVFLYVGHFENSIYFLHSRRHLTTDQSGALGGWIGALNLDDTEIPTRNILFLSSFVFAMHFSERSHVNARRENRDEKA